MVQYHSMTTEYEITYKEMKDLQIQQLTLVYPINDGVDGDEKEQLFIYLYIDKRGRYKNPRLRVSHVRERRKDEDGYGDPGREWKKINPRLDVDLARTPLNLVSDQLVHWLKTSKDLKNGAPLLTVLPLNNVAGPFEAVLNEGLNRMIIKKRETANGDIFYESVQQI